MGWETIARLIITYGIDQAYKIWQIARSGEPDEAAWEKLRALSLKSYDDYIAEAKARAQERFNSRVPETPPAA